ncbi:MAG TPA: PHP domain-containing protein [Candidatus Limnocylindrales bacterium]|nr:PHP domain-containing protein [Candidatus Limnocylindrales bacterium]
MLLESAIADLPADLRWLFESRAVTIEQLAALHQALGVTSVADLRAAVNEHAICRVAGMDEAIETAVSAALPDLRTAVPRIPLGRAVAVSEPILARLRSLAGIVWAVAAGSLRRGQETVGDIELVAAASNPSAAVDELLRASDASRCLHRSERRVYLLFERTQVGVRLAEPSNAGATLLNATGSVGHLEALGACARTKGFHLTAEGLHGADGTLKRAATEEEIYGALGLPFVPPEIRHGQDEVAAALAGTLPALLSRTDIRGDLHMHTEWSDGRDSIEAMVETARTLGYEYVAITDHSPRAAAVRTVSPDSLAQQAEEIARVGERYPDVTILRGCEVDILPDGRLDLADRVLERLDIVLASLHEHAGQSPDQLFWRYTEALKHPLVTMVAHPTNRLLPNRAGYRLDYDRLFELAAETGTVFEIDGAPAHLDLDGTLARKAITAGVALAVSSDSHRADLLDRQMALGVITARRGWVEPRHVLNTRSLAEVRAIVARKRGR